MQQLEFPFARCLPGESPFTGFGLNKDDLFEAFNSICKYNYIPDTMVMHPDVYANMVGDLCEGSDPNDLPTYKKEILAEWKEYSETNEALSVKEVSKGIEPNTIVKFNPGEWSENVNVSSDSTWTSIFKDISDDTD